MINFKLFVILFMTSLILHDDREMQRLDVYRPKQAQGEDLPIIISVHGGAWMYGDKERYQ